MAESSDGAGRRGRGKGRQFEPGKSGNPGGRRPLPDDVKEALRAAGPRAITRLIELMDSENEKIALQASDLVAQRVYGRQAMGLTLPDDPAARLKVLETALQLRGIAGDTSALVASLAALAPEKYGRNRDDLEDIDPPPPMSFVRLGQARPGHKVEADGTD